MSNDNLRLVSKSSREWGKFILDEFYPLDVKSAATDFAGENGTNYTTLIKQARVNKLANSIKHNMTTSLYQLCFENGYKSISSASAQFKSVKGMSLKQYRNIIRG